MNPAHEFRKSEPCVFFEGDYRYGFGCNWLVPQSAQRNGLWIGIQLVGMGSDRSDGTQIETDN